MDLKKSNFLDSFKSNSGPFKDTSHPVYPHLWGGLKTVVGFQAYYVSTLTIMINKQVEVLRMKKFFYVR